MNTFYKVWGATTPEETQLKLEEQRQEVLETLTSQGISQSRNLEEQALLLVGKGIYKILIKGGRDWEWS
ncbi:MAG: hypothetical protein HDS52_07815 [Barnesiella sp.]|nr:hypothetical protein [Barnesiella sp.]